VIKRIIVVLLGIVLLLAAIVTVNTLRKGFRQLDTWRRCWLTSRRSHQRLLTQAAQP